MRSGRNNSGFSLTEVLMAVGILSIGMLFIAGTFPTGLYLSTVAVERSIAAVAAEEAFAKIRLYGVNTTDPDLVTNACVNFTKVSLVSPVQAYEFEYPSIDDVPDVPKKYYWRALCRKIDAFDVQVTVFVCRKSGTGDSQDPEEVAVTVGINNELLNPSKQAVINDGYTIIDSETGRIYRVMERYWRGADNVINLDRAWGGPLPGSLVWVWVIPPPPAGGRNPCIGVFQKVIRF